MINVSRQVFVFSAASDKRDCASRPYAQGLSTKCGLQPCGATLFIALAAKCTHAVYYKVCQNMSVRNKNIAEQTRSAMF